MTHVSPPPTTPGVWLARMPPEGQVVVASTARSGWHDVHGAVLEGAVREPFDYSAPFPTVLFFLKGVGECEWRRGQRFSRFSARPGHVLVTPPGGPHRLRINLPVEMLWCAIAQDVIDRIGDDTPDPGHAPFEVVESITRSDEGLWSLGRRLADRILSPIHGSHSYAGALQTQIAIHLLWHHSSPHHGAAAGGDAVPDRRLESVIRYMRQNLTGDISLEKLAEIAGLSPNYFLGAFREATGRTPHRYVNELRIARACELLRDPRRPITEVSLAVGFSSQSHLTEVFRRTMQTTPAAYRSRLLGLNGSAEPSQSLGSGEAAARAGREKPIPAAGPGPGKAERSTGES
ncbi:MAG: AraC family transcriptional regulator [Isosphaeraceae bacterium]